MHEYLFVRGLHVDLTDSHPLDLIRLASNGLAFLLSMKWSMNRLHCCDSQGDDAVVQGIK